jgi:hypothetical protein
MCGHQGKTFSGKPENRYLAGRNPAAALSSSLSFLPVSDFQAGKIE